MPRTTICRSEDWRPGRGAYAPLVPLDIASPSADRQSSGAEEQLDIA
jgi:hypothetical protein